MKNFINKILDAPKMIRTIWIMLWVILVILLIMKFCFGIWYPIVVKNETFISMCNFIDNNKILDYGLKLILYIISGNLIILTSLGIRNYSKWYLWIVFIILNTGLFYIKYFSDVAGLIIEIIMILIFIIINIKRNTFKHNAINFLFPIIYYVLINLWQLTLLVVRDDGHTILSDYSSLIILIVQIDYYIFLTITWIGVSFMGLVSWGWFFGKDITVLKAEKSKELSKVNPNMKKIAKIDERIAELEKEGK